MRFYVMGDPDDDCTYDTQFYKMKPVHRGDARTCPQCHGFVSMLPWLPPYRAEIRTHGKALGDVAFGPGGDLLVSARFREAWEASNLCGLEFLPLERLRVRPARLGKKPHTYFHVAIRLFGTQIDVERSYIKRTEPMTCNKCKSGGLLEGVRGFAIDEASWTGEDIFFPWGLSADIVVTDRVRQLRDDYDLKNVNLTPVEEFLWDPRKQWTPYDHSHGGDYDTPSHDENHDESDTTN